MARNTRGTSLLFTIAAAVVALAALGTAASTSQASHHPGGMDAMSLDMNVAGNTATSIGSRQSCGEANPGGTLTFDITAEGIPPYNDNGTTHDTSDDTDGLDGFTFNLIYDEAALTLQPENQSFLLTANPGSALFPSSQFLPDTDGNNYWISGAFDNNSPGSSMPESGSGVLSRLTIAVAPAAGSGFYALKLAFNAHLDAAGNVLFPDVTHDALLAVGVLCLNAPPTTPTPVPTGGPATPTTTPQPNPTPTPGPGVGGMNRMALDAKTAGNTASAIGPHDACVTAAPGDQVTIDLTADDVPAYSTNGTSGNFTDDYGGIIGYSARLIYPENVLTVEAESQQFMLASAAGSTVGNGSQALPDTNNDNGWRSEAVDTSSPPSIPESGDGVLTRLTIQVDATASAGLYSLSLDPAETVHLDAVNYAYAPNALAGAYISVSMPCDIDADGVTDNLDACQTIPGPASNNGCPPSGPSAVGGIAGLQEVRGEAWVTPESRQSEMSGRILVALAIVFVVGGLTAMYAMSRRSRRRLG